MTVVDKPEPATARVKRPSLVFRMFLAVFLSGIVLAWLIPTLVSREIGVGPWLPWVVVLGSVALCAGPEILRRVRYRR
jgi:hypothetical protein